MRDPYRYPKIRHPIDIRMDSIEGNDVIVISCPLGLSRDPLVLLAAVGPLLFDFDGQRSVEEIVQRYQIYGVQEALVQELVSLLNTGLFLETPAFFKAFNEEREFFQKSPVRPSSLAGAGFPADPSQLRNMLTGYLEKGAARLQQKGIISQGNRELFCLISPHIDYHRGGHNYGITYTHLKGEQHTLYVLCGTSHQYSPHVFHLTKKHFDTPLGRLANAIEYVEALANRYTAPTLFADEYLHKQEHSLELQAPFLALLQQEARIFPFLVGSFYQYLKSGSYPEEHNQYNDFAGALTETITDAMNQGERVCFIAGVDMAHVGAFFGDPGALSPEQMETVRLRDQEYLNCVLSQDRHALWQHIAEDGDARKICGFPTLYLLLDVFDRMQLSLDGTLFEYEQAVNYQNDCAVTFAGLGLYQRSTAGSAI